MQSFTRHQQTRHPGSGEIIIVVVILVIVFAVILYPVFFSRPYPARQSLCQSNVRQLMVAIVMYQQDHGDKFPDKAIVWQDINYPPKALLCPTYGMKKGLAYGYNASLSGKRLKSPGMPEAQNLPVLADSNTPNHLLNSPADIDFRHTQKATVGFADGHVAMLQPAYIQNVPVKEEDTSDAN
ncbi:MAG: hypothetical protein ACYDCO_09690 [Armatimonadota bacterium]